MGFVIRKLCHLGTILQRNYRKMTILWSFSYNFYIKFLDKNLLEQQHDSVISKRFINNLSNTIDNFNLKLVIFCWHKLKFKFKILISDIIFRFLGHFENLFMHQNDPWIMIRADTLFSLIWVQTDCKCYHQQVGWIILYILIQSRDKHF